MTTKLWEYPEDVQQEILMLIPQGVPKAAFTAGAPELEWVWLDYQRHWRELGYVVADDGTMTRVEEGGI